MVVVGGEDHHAVDDATDISHHILRLVVFVELKRYVGFDFALTPDGWVVIEGNWGNFPHQVCVHHGIKKEFESLMNS